MYRNIPCARLSCQTRSLKKRQKHVNKHEDIYDEDQSVSEVKITTTAVDTQTKGHVGTVPENDVAVSVINDGVKMMQLIPGMQYTIEGALVDIGASDFKAGKVIYAAGNGSGNSQGNGSGNKVTERAGIIINFLKDNPETSINTLAKELNLSRKQVVVGIDYLKNQNRLKFVGTNRKGHWEII